MPVFVPAEKITSKKVVKKPFRLNNNSKKGSSDKENRSKQPNRK
jgi:hypothetical protein